jgi:hypothetical protein
MCKIHTRFQCQNLYRNIMDDADIDGKIVLNFFLTEIIKRYIVNIVHFTVYI